jgi:hypothetical protein
MALSKSEKKAGILGLAALVAFAAPNPELRGLWIVIGLGLLVAAFAVK